jgi:hypothetical protein
MTTATMPEANLSDFTPEMFEAVHEYADAFIKGYSLNAEVTPDELYDARVQAVLDQYWPGSTDLKCIKRSGNVRNVYSVQYQGSETIVKSTPYHEEDWYKTEQYKTFLNFMNEKVNVAAFIEPSLARSDDGDLMITMSLFANGYAPVELPPDAPMTWIYDENAVKAVGKYWGDYRHRAIEFKSQYPDTFDFFPKWDEGINVWQKHFTPMTIPVTDETFGVVHGDMHRDNWMIQPEDHDQYSITTIDYDNAQRGWYITDPGTVTWYANIQMLTNRVPDREEKLAQFKEWLLEAYEWPTTDEELMEGCRWRQQFMFYITIGAASVTPKTSPVFWKYAGYIILNLAGLIPTC